MFLTTTDVFIPSGSASYSTAKVGTALISPTADARSAHGRLHDVGKETCAGGTSAPVGTLLVKPRATVCELICQAKANNKSAGANGHK